MYGFSHPLFKYTFLFIITKILFTQALPTKILALPTKLVGRPAKFIGQATKFVGRPTKMVGLPTKIIGRPTKMVGLATKIIGKASFSIGMPPKSTKIKNALMVLSGYYTFFLAFDWFCNPFD